MSGGGRTAVSGRPPVLGWHILFSSFRAPYVLVLQDGELLNDEPVRIVVRAPCVLERAGGDKAALGHVALPDDHLAGIRRCLVRINGEIAHHAVHMHHLVDVARNQPIVIALLGKVHIIVVGALVRQLQGAVNVVPMASFWGESEKNSS